MEWLKKILEKHNAGDELVTAIMTDAKDVNYIPKDRFDEVNNSLKELKGQIADRDKQLKDLGEKAKGHDDLTKQIADLQEANKKTAGDYQAKIRQMTIDRAIEKELEGCKHPELLSTKFDTKTIEFNEDGTIKNLDVLSNQTKTFKDETYKDFWTQELGGKTPPNNGGSSRTKDPGEMTMEEYSAWYNERNKNN